MYEDVAEAPKIKRLLFRPHKYQRDIITQLKRFNVVVAHRRFGKTIMCVNLLIKAALQANHPFWTGSYLAPFYKQSKKVAWRYLKFYTQNVPGVKFYENELTAVFPNGATLVLLGANNPDALRGIGLDIVVLDEVAQMPPGVWGEVILPALSDRKGQAIFIGTPKGQNLLYEQWEFAKNDDKSFAIMYKVDETDILDPEVVADAKARMTDDEYNQEYRCSFFAANRGAYYDKLMVEARDEERIGDVPYDPRKYVHTAWDIGVTDATAIWFYQKDSVHGAIRLIDYYEMEGEGLNHYVKIIKEKPYTYGYHYAPIDMKKTEFGTGKKIIQLGKEMGIDFKVVPKVKREEGINAVRMMLPRCYFDKKKCERGILALKNYSKKWNEKMGIYLNEPVHDEYSHAADAFRYLAISYKEKDTTKHRKSTNYRENRKRKLL